MKLSIYAFHCFLLFFSVQCVAQVSISGIVIDSISQKSISNAIIYTLGSDSTTIIDYNFCDDKGVFKLEKEALSFPLLLKISKLGYQSRFFFYQNKEALSEELQFLLVEEFFEIKEIVILGRSKIKEKGDTTTFDVEQYRDSTERNLEQLLAKIPGMEIDRQDGTIMFKGKMIKRILIDGDDLSGNDYRIVSRTIDPALLETIQVIDRFEANDFLRKITTSDDQVLNITLKEQFKISTSGEISPGISSMKRYNHDLKILSFSPNIKVLSKSNFNTIGISKYISSTTFSSLPKTPTQFVQSLNRNDEINEFINTIELNNLPISLELYNFNDMKLSDLNFAIKYPKFKASGYLSYFREKSETFQSIVNQYNLFDATILIDETKNSNRTDEYISTSLNSEYIISPKAQLSYQGYFLKFNTLGSQNIILNSLEMNTSVPIYKTIFKSELNYIHKLKKATFIASALLYENTRDENLIIENSYPRILPLNSLLHINAEQYIPLSKNNKQFFSSLSFGQDSSRFLISLGVNQSNQYAQPYLRLYDTLNVEINTNELTNYNVDFLNINYFSQFKYEKKWLKTDFISEVKLGHFNIEKNQQEAMDYLYVFPQLSLKRQTENNFYAFSYNYDVQVFNLNSLVNTSYLRDNRTLASGTEVISPLRTQKFLFNYTKSNLQKSYNYYFNVALHQSTGGYQNTINVEREFIASTYILNTYPNLRFNLNGTIDNFVDLISSRIFFKPFFSIFNTQNEIANLGEQNIQVQRYGANMEMKSGFLQFFNFNLGLVQDYRKNIFKFDNNESSNSFSTSRAFLNLFFNISEYLRLELLNEAYYISSDANIDNTQFLYSNLSFYLNPKNKSWYFNINVHNLFNTDNWVYAVQDEVVATTSSTKLQSRYVMFKLYYSFNTSKAS